MEKLEQFAFFDEPHYNHAEFIKKLDQYIEETKNNLLNSQNLSEDKK